MYFLNRRGVALLQVLVVSAVLAGLSAMVMRVLLSRAATARQTRRTVISQMLIESCMAEVNDRLANLPIQDDSVNHIKGYATVLDRCQFSWLDDTPNEFACQRTPFPGGDTYTIKVQIGSRMESGQKKCVITYDIEDGVSRL